MPRFAANLTMMFTEYPFLDRFAAAARAGFEAVEFLFPYDHPMDAIAERLSKHGLKQALFNIPAGSWEAGDRGMAALGDRFGELQDSVGLALRYAEVTGVGRLHLMAGIADNTDSRAIDAYRRAVEWSAEALNSKGIDLLLEPINARNMPGYFLNNFAFAEDLIEKLKLPNLKLQFDIYHRQIIHGDVTKALERAMPIIGHIQTASVPLRHEPFTGELNDGFVFDAIDRLGYSGFVGCEYNPRAGTAAGLDWLTSYRASAPTETV